MNELVSSLISVVVGGAVGAFAPLIPDYWRRPILAADVGKTIDGSSVETDAEMRDPRTGQLLGTVRQKYLRIRVTNTGRIIARNVSVAVSQIALSRPGAGKLSLGEEVLDLPLALPVKPFSTCQKAPIDSSISAALLAISRTK
jgi:hypothetical protein